MRISAVVVVSAIAGGLVAAPSGDLLNAMKRLEEPPTTGVISGTVYQVNHAEIALTPEDLAAAKKAGVLAEKVRNVLAQTEEMFSGDDYLCTTTLYTNTSLNDPQTSHCEREVVLLKGNLAVQESVSPGGEPVYIITDRKTLSDLPRYRQTAALTLPRYCGLKRLRTALEETTSSSRWTETRREGGRTIHAAVEPSENQKAVLECDLDSGGKATSVRAFRLINGLPVLVKEVEVTYKEGDEVVDAVRHREFSVGSNGESLPESEFSVSNIHRRASQESLPSVRRFLEQRAPETVKDARLGRRVPLANVDLD